MSPSEGEGKTSASRTRYQREDYLRALRQAWALAPEDAEGLTQQSYSGLIAASAVDGPSAVRVIQVFKTWHAALDEAGVPAMEPARAYRSAWTDDEILQAVAEYLADSSTTGAYSGWDPWRRATKTAAPSAQTLRNRFGSWSQVKTQALAHGRKA